jgi:hypothetical protein
MLDSIKTHWRTTLFGALAATLGAFAATKGLDTMSTAQALAAFGSCAFTALLGAFSSDAKTPPQ